MYSGSMNGSFTAGKGRFTLVNGEVAAWISQLTRSTASKERTSHDLDVLGVEGGAKDEAANATETCGIGTGPFSQAVPLPSMRRTFVNHHGSYRSTTATYIRGQLLQAFLRG